MARGRAARRLREPVLRRGYLLSSLISFLKHFRLSVQKWSVSVLAKGLQQICNLKRSRATSKIANGENTGYGRKMPFMDRHCLCILQRGCVA
jgi:hypothetical protein